MHAARAATRAQAALGRPRWLSSFIPEARGRRYGGVLEALLVSFTHRLPEGCVMQAQPTECFYHGTSLESALAIQESGFRVDLSGTNAGAMLGAGVYITTTLEKAMNYAKVKEHSGAILKLKVDLGKCLPLKANDSHMKDWHTLGYDSAFSPAGANGVREENCVRDPARIQIEDVLLGHTADAARAGYAVKDGKLYHNLEGISAVVKQLAMAAGVLLVEHPHAPCNGVFRPTGKDHGGYPCLMNQSFIELSRHWTSAGGVWRLKLAVGADGLESCSIATGGEIPIGTNKWENMPAAAGDPADSGRAGFLCTTSLLRDEDPLTTAIEDCYSQAAISAGHREALKSAVAIAAGVGAAAAAGAGAVAAAPAVLTAGVAVGQGAAIGALSGGLAAKNIFNHPVLGPAARELLKTYPSLNGLSEDDLLMRFAGGCAALGAGRVVALGTAAMVSAGVALGTEIATAGAGAVAAASPVTPVAMAVVAVTTLACQPEPEPEPEPEPLNLTASVGDHNVVTSKGDDSEHAEYEIIVRTCDISDSGRLGSAYVK